jgi:hypothetical protein
MIAYSLKNSVTIEKLQSDINKLISGYKEPPENLILYIDVRKVTTDDNSLIPKLEYKED